MWDIATESSGPPKGVRIPDARLRGYTIII